MTLKVLLPTLVLFFFITSCAKNPGKTDANFKLRIASLTDLGNAGAGGAMLWGKSDKGDTFGMTISLSSSNTIELTNGVWTFWSVAWEGKNNIYNFQGLTRCAKSSAIFNGTDAQVNINLSNTTCADNDFSPAISNNSGVYEFPSISRYECDKLSDHNGLGCGVNLGYKTTSRRILMPSFKKASGEAAVISGSALVSSCHVSGSGTFQMADTYLPVGNGVIPAFTMLQSFFTSTSCDETDPKGFVKQNFEMGLKASTNVNALSFINNGSCNGTNFTQEACTLFGGTYSAGTCLAVPSANTLDISESACTAYGGSYTASAIKRLELITVIPDDILCSGKRIDPSITTPHVFASGLGIVMSPYRICTEYQLNSIGASYVNTKFSLHSDLDMNKTSIFGNQFRPACLSKNPGANFLPIGGLYDGACNEIAAVDFGAGLFNGNGHTISNIRLSAKVNNLGFIRSGGSVTNLTLDNIEIEGMTNVGAFSGNTPLLLSNLFVNKGKIRGSDVVGGIVGSYSPSVATLNNVHAKKLSLQINKSSGRVGGLIGDTAGLTSMLTISKSSFEGLINASANAAQTGGLIGNAGITPVTINESFSSGAMLVHGSAWAGGLVGNAQGGITINNSYSRMNFGPLTYDVGEGGSIGGLIGAWGIHASLVNSFYHGSIMHPCFKMGTPCGIGTFTGGALVTSLNNSAGTFLYKEWLGGSTIASLLALEEFETNATKSSLIGGASPAVFKDVGASFVRLEWESDTCAQYKNNISVAQQSATRGSMINPIVLCNKEQWREIKNYPNLNYVVEDNIGLGEIPFTSVVSNFYGSINGKGNIVGGLYNVSDLNASGIIVNNYGKISNTIFAASYLDINNSNASGAGLIAANRNTGEIFNNQFLSVNLEKGDGHYVGVIAGVNNGKILRNKVSSLSSIKNTGGLLVGINTATGIMTGNKVEGTLHLLSSNDNQNFGLVAGENSGKISETDVNGALINSAMGNTGPGTTIGSFLGENSGVIEDILIRPSTKLQIEVDGPTYGQVFGQNLTGASVKHVLALNEIPLSSSAFNANINSFVGFSDAGVPYRNSFLLTGSVFRFDSTPVNFISCSETASVFTYTLNSPLVLITPYTNGFYLPYVTGQVLTSRITSSVSAGATSFVSSEASGEFTIPCSYTAGVFPSGTTLLYPIQTLSDFSHSEVHKISPVDVKKFSNFCSSSIAVTDLNKPAASCDLVAGEFDIVEDKGVNGFGFERLLNAHKTRLLTGDAPDNRPIWVMSDEGYPKLFLAD